jgi:2-polyprenyl-3-methyl-5-hydroxy-6-metoxy-1,4-benzoquinol methylase
MITLLGRLVRIIELLCCSLHLTRWYYDFHRDQVEAEIRFANPRRGLRILCVGAGPIPHTALRIVAETDAIVDAIDNRPWVVRCAMRSVKRFGVAERVRIVLADGLRYPLDSYDIIFIANHVSSKGAIVRRLQSEARPGAIAVLRNSMFYRPIDTFDATMQVRSLSPVSRPSGWKSHLFTSYVLIPRAHRPDELAPGVAATTS